MVVILDNLNVHNARALRDLVAEHAKQIALCYLPSYAPERNADEYVNGGAEAKECGRGAAG